jgi:hypothetical protein
MLLYRTFTLPIIAALICLVLLNLSTQPATALCCHSIEKQNGPP